MKIRVKTLKGDEFFVEGELSDKVLALKDTIGQNQGFDDPAGCKLIYNGNILKDDISLEEAKIVETGFLVVMPPKKTVKPKAAPAAPTAPAATAAPTPAPKEETKTPVPAPTEAEAAPKSAAPSQPEQISEPGAAERSSNELVTGAEYEARLAQLVEMGFEESQAKLAMRAAFMNPDRAVEYLFTGIPEMPELNPQAAAAPATATTAPASGGTEQTTATSATTTTASASRTGAAEAQPRQDQPFNMFEQQARTGSTDSGGGGGDNYGALAFLRALPQFNMMKRVAQQNPALLGQVFQQLGRTNPELLSIINANQNEFAELLNEPIPPEEQAELDQAIEGLGHAELGGERGEGGDGQRPPGATYIQVTEEERAQIERLESIVGPMGVNRDAVLEAWLACDKNEELAANYLLNSMDEVLREDEGGDDATS